MLFVYGFISGVAFCVLPAVAVLIFYLKGRDEMEEELRHQVKYGGASKHIQR